MKGVVKRGGGGVVHFVESDKCKRLNEEGEGHVEAECCARCKHGSSLGQKRGFSKGGSIGDIKVPF